MVRYLRQVWFILKGSRNKLPQLLIIFIFTSILEILGLGLIPPFLQLASNPNIVYENQILNWFYSIFNFQSPNQFIAILALIFSFVYCLRSLLYFLSKLYVVKFSTLQKGQMFLRLLDSYLNVPYTFHLSRNTSSFIKNVIVETQQFYINCLTPLLNSIGNLIMILFLLTALARTNLLLLVSVMGIIILISLGFYPLRKKFKKWGRDNSESHQEMIRVMNHALGSVKETRIIGCEQYFFDAMSIQVEKFRRATNFRNSLQFLPKIMTETMLIIVVMIFAAFAQIYWQESAQEITTTLAIFSVASIRLIPSSSQLISAMGRLQSTVYSVRILYEDLKEAEKNQVNKPLFTPQKYEKSSIPGNVIANDNIIKFRDCIELKNLFYRYPESESLTIQNICMKIKKGDSIGLIGKSGAGKTTLVDMLLGLLIPEKGNIEVDGMSIYDNIRSWQNLLGYIPQSIFLTDDSIERNIAFGIPDSLIDKVRVQQAIASAQLTTFIQSLPNGVNTIVGERGVKLSGGQRQRVGIARAIYHQREILVLDEATAALDNETERLVNESINSLSGEKTLIIIAHRLSTVKNCDCLYLLETGRVVKSGSYQDVLGQ